MTYKSFVLITVAVMMVQGLIAIVLSHGINGHYFQNNPTRAEAMKKLRADKPKTANAIAACYALVLFEFFIVAISKIFWR